MKRPQRICLTLLLLLTATLTAGAQENTIALFSETFDTNNGKGGKGKNGAETQYSGSIASGKAAFDNDGWDAPTSISGAYQCIKFGTGNSTNKVNGVCTTPDIQYVSASNTITLTYEAVGWKTGDNTLTVSATGANVSGDTNITLQNGEDDASGDDNTKWETYIVNITPTAPTFSITFTGWRGFLDNIVIKEMVTTVPAPTLTDNFSFWPNTTETAEALFTLTPSTLTTVYYTTDGSEPTSDSPNVATLKSNIKVTGTTTVKAVAYVGTESSSVVSRTYTQGATVSGIAAFRALAEGTEARLFLSSANDARVTFTSGNAAYLRDNTGALCLDFATTATFNPAPAFEQHVAGWIVGRYQTVDGLPTLVATQNTNTNFLALAAKRNEADVTAKSIDATTLSANLADYVTLTEAPFDGTLTADNRFVSAVPYTGSMADVTGIVTAANRIAPTETVTFVIDETKAFTSPASDLTNVDVRLKRTLGKDYWNTFCVPFNINTMEGELREYDETDGTTMKFKSAAGIEAGKPYLVKPTATIENPVYHGVTLKSTAAQEVGSTYKFVGTYSPTTLATNSTQRYLGTDGLLHYSNGGSSLKGMRAYFDVPVGANLGLLFDDDDATAVLSIATSSQSTPSATVYDLSGRRLSNSKWSNGQMVKWSNGQMKPGIYIVNGKKMVIH